MDSDFVKFFVVLAAAIAIGVFGGMYLFRLAV